MLDGTVVTQSSVINEYLEDAFPETPPLRPGDAAGLARMRIRNKFVDEQVMNHVSMHAWHRHIGVLARSMEPEAFDRLIERFPLHEQRAKWRTARKGFDVAELANATRKVHPAHVPGAHR